MALVYFRGAKMLGQPRYTLFPFYKDVESETVACWVIGSRDIFRWAAALLERVWKKQKI